MKRSQVGFLAAVLVVLSGCSTTNMSQEGETVATLVFMPLLMPSWDQRPRSRMDDAPVLRKSPAFLETLLTLPLMPLFLPSWEEERIPLTEKEKKGRIGGYWAYQVGGLRKRKKAPPKIEIGAEDLEVNPLEDAPMGEDAADGDADDGGEDLGEDALDIEYPDEDAELRDPEEVDPPQDD